MDDSTPFSPGSTGSTRSTATVRRADELLAELRGLLREAEERSRERTADERGKRRWSGASARRGTGHNRRVIAHWDEVESRRAEVGHLAGAWADLGAAAGTQTVGVKRITIDPGKWSTPFHFQTGEEEIFFVLGGSGICLLRRPGVRGRRRGLHRPPRSRGATRCARATTGSTCSPSGTRSGTEAAHLPRARVSWLGGSWVEAGRGDHPWERETAVGEPDVPELGDRPESVVHVDDVEGDDGGSWRRLARQAGAVRTGLNWGRLQAGAEGAPPHSHSADEEIFVVLEGEGVLELQPSPQRVRSGGVYEEHAIRGGRRDLASCRHRARAWVQGGRPRPDLSGLRNAAAGRRLLLPALEQDLLPWARADRPPG